MRRFLPLIVFAALAALFGLALAKGKAPVSAFIGKAAPAAGLPKGITGAYAVNFFASWCVPCAAEQPVLERLAQKGLRIYGVAWKDKDADVAAWLGKHGNPYAAVAQDYDGRAGIEWGVSGVPETYIVGADGIVRFKSAGPVTDDMIEDLLNAAGKS